MGVTSAGRGHGSTFFFELPVYGLDSNPNPNPQPAPLQPSSRYTERATSLPRFPRSSRVACDSNENDNVVVLEQGDLVGGQSAYPTNRTIAWQEEGAMNCFYTHIPPLYVVRIYLCMHVRTFIIYEQLTECCMYVSIYLKVYYNFSFIPKESLLVGMVKMILWSIWRFSALFAC